MKIAAPLLTMGLCTALALEAHAESPHVGVMLDVGVPDGVSGSAVLRPIPQLRVHAGVGHNLVSPGVRGGLGLRPLTGVLSPTIAIEGGRYWQANALFMVHAFAPDVNGAEISEVRVGYDYMNAHLGLDIGAQHTVFFLQLGVSSLWADVDYDVLLEAGGANQRIKGHWETTVTTPSGRLGLMVFF